MIGLTSMKGKEEKTGLFDYFKKWVQKLQEWVKPDPADKPLVQVLKLFYKGIALLVLIALSPAILVVMLFVFFAAF